MKYLLFSLLSLPSIAMADCQGTDAIVSCAGIPVKWVDLSTVTTSISTRGILGVDGSSITFSSATAVLANAVMGQSAYVLRVSSQNNTTMVGVKANGALTLQGRTIAQLQVDIPSSSAAGADHFFCSNCTPKKIVIGTGTSAGNWADAVGGTFK